MTSEGLLSLKWNNHKTTFFHVLSTIRSKEAYCDATIACDGRFYPVHKLVMSTCSDYFEEMFERTNCKHPVIVLKDIRHEDLEALLNYMYMGEVTVLKDDIAGLIKAAECLKIRGLAVPDEFSTEDSPWENKRGATKDENTQAKRIRYDDNTSVSINSANSSSSHNSSRQQEANPHSFSASGQSSSFRRKASSPPPRTSDSLTDDPRTSKNNNQDDNLQTSAEKSRSPYMPSSPSQNNLLEVVLDEPPGVKEEVKEEPVGNQDLEELQRDPNKFQESWFSYDHMSERDSMSNIEDGGSHGAQGFDAQMMPSVLQSMEELVAQAMPGSSGMQRKSLWKSEGNLCDVPPEFSDDESGPLKLDEAAHLRVELEERLHAADFHATHQTQALQQQLKSKESSDFMMSLAEKPLLEFFKDEGLLKKVMYLGNPDAPLEPLMKFFQEKGLIKKVMYCDHCKILMKLVIDNRKKSVSDGYYWKCYNVDCEKRYATKTIRDGSIFNAGKITLKQWLHLMMHFTSKTPVNKAAEMVKLSRETVSKTYPTIRQLFEK